MTVQDPPGPVRLRYTELRRLELRAGELVRKLRDAGGTGDHETRAELARVLARIAILEADQ